MSNFKRAPVTGGQPRKNVLASLRMAQIVSSKPVLPAEIMSAILDYLAVPDLLRFASVSKRLQEMVYDDSRWIQRLKRMGCWNEAEARRRAEWRPEEIASAEGPQDQIQTGGRNKTPGRRGEVESGPRLRVNGAHAFGSALSDTSRQRAPNIGRAGGTSQGLSDGFDATKLSSPIEPSLEPGQRRDLTLQVLKTVVSARGLARHEYGKVHKALAPYYNDISEGNAFSDLLVFKKYNKPEEQAQILSQLQSFCKSDLAQGWKRRETLLAEVVTLFENAALREFRQGYETGNIDGRMRQYARILHVLNGGQASIETFALLNHLITQKSKLGNPIDCYYHSSGDVLLERTQAFFNRLSVAYSEEISIIDRAFPASSNVIVPYLDRIGQDVLSPFLTTLFDEIHRKSVESYLKAVAGTYAQCMNLARSLQPTQQSGDDFYEAVDRMIGKVFEPHIDLYLGEELNFFKQGSDAAVNDWDRQLSDQAASTESFFMSNINRQADKKDFLTSFKKVVMMPVNILPSFPTFSSNKPTAKVLVNGDSLGAEQSAASRPPSRSSTPFPWSGSTSTSLRPSTPSQEAPSTELAAKAAIMNSKLEGIRSLFSIEVALNLVHAAKSSLERAAQFVQLGGEAGKAAQQQCEAIFVLLLQILGTRHVKAGFDKAVDHLSNYNPRESTGHSEPGVQPLVTFLELVNVGDLIQQILDVFYEQELIGANLTDRNDFLDAANKEKKKFEQMLDERVAAGLNKGIDVLMEEVEYTFATMQLPTDFNPAPLADAKHQTLDIGPSETAKRIADLVSSHTRMLVGSTDKSMLDVFNQEVGLRLFTALCKHLKRQRISVDGSIKLISDMTHYFTCIETLKNQDLLLYFTALRELSQIYLIDPSDSKELATIIADGDRFHGIFRAEEVYEFAERRADWYQVKRSVERAMYGIGCVVM